MASTAKKTSTPATKAKSSSKKKSKKMSATDAKWIDAGIRAAGDATSALIDVIKNEIKNWQDTRKVKKEAKEKVDERIRLEKEKAKIHEEYSSKHKSSTPSDQDPQTNEDNIAAPQQFYSAPKPMSDIINQTFAEIPWVVPRLAIKGQVSALVAAADVGKTIMTTNIGILVAKGEKMSFLSDKYTASPRMNVLVYILEPRAGEFSGRFKPGFVFPDNLSKVTYDELPSQTFSGLMDHIAYAATLFTADTLLIIDPITKFTDFNADDFYNKIQQIKSELSKKGITLSVLVTMHADETKEWIPITKENIRGGDRPIQVFDSVFAFCKERRFGHRFIYTLKAPKGTAGHEDVIVVSFSEDKLFTHFEYVGQSSLKDALPLQTKASKEASPQTDSRSDQAENIDIDPSYTMYRKAKEMYNQIDPDTGKKYLQAKVAQKLGVSARTLQLWKNKYESNGTEE